MRVVLHTVVTPAVGRCGSENQAVIPKRHKSSFFSSQLTKIDTMLEFLWPLVIIILGSV